MQVEDPFSKWQKQEQIFEVKKAELLTTCTRCYNTPDPGVKHSTDLSESRQCCTHTFPLPEWLHFQPLKTCSGIRFASLPDADEKPLGLHCGAGQGRWAGQRTTEGEGGRKEHLQISYHQPNSLKPAIFQVPQNPDRVGGFSTPKGLKENPVLGKIRTVPLNFLLICA